MAAFQVITEGWKALQASGLYERRSYLTEVYRNALAREVRALGYEVENRHDVRGRDKGFEIAGFSKDLLDKYSQTQCPAGFGHSGIHQFTRPCTNRQRGCGTRPGNTS
jgi:TrwC relaxase